MPLDPDRSPSSVSAQTARTILRLLPWISLRRVRRSSSCDREWDGSGLTRARVGGRGRRLGRRSAAGTIVTISDADDQFTP